MRFGAWRCSLSSPRVAAVTWQRLSRSARFCLSFYFIQYFIFYFSLHSICFCNYAHFPKWDTWRHSLLFSSILFYSIYQLVSEPLQEKRSPHFYCDSERLFQALLALKERIREGRKAGSEAKSSKFEEDEMRDGERWVLQGNSDSYLRRDAAADGIWAEKHRALFCGVFCWIRLSVVTKCCQWRRQDLQPPVSSNVQRM